MYAWQWGLPSVFLGFAEELTIATLTLSSLLSLWLVMRRPRGTTSWALAALLMAGSVSYAHSVRGGRVVEVQPTVINTASSQRVAVITGANQGLGRMTALFLAQSGYRIVLCSRSVEAGQEAAQYIRQHVPGASIDVMELHLAPLARVKDFHTRLAALHPRVDLLINNAGMGFAGTGTTSNVTPDGLSWILGVNHVAHHYLTRLVCHPYFTALFPFFTVWLR